MFSISSLFGKTSKAARGLNDQQILVGKLPTLHDLVRMAISEFFKETGIPLDLFAVTVKFVKQENQVTRADVKILVLKWHEGLGKYAFPIQNKLIQTLRANAIPYQQVEDISVSWVFHSQCVNVPSALPLHHYWNAPKLKFDLPQTSHDIRPADRIAYQATQPMSLASFAPTVPAGLMH